MSGTTTMLHNGGFDCEMGIKPEGFELSWCAVSSLILCNWKLHELHFCNNYRLNRTEKELNDNLILFTDHAYY